MLCGYSLGGRLALRAALRHPGRYRGVITIGASAGIEEPVARSPRRGRRAARRVDGDHADLGDREGLGAPAAVRRPGRRARGDAAARQAQPRPACARPAVPHRGPGSARPGLARAREAAAAAPGARGRPRRALRPRRRADGRRGPSAGPSSSNTPATRRISSGPRPWRRSSRTSRRPERARARPPPRAPRPAPPRPRPLPGPGRAAPRASRPAGAGSTRAIRASNRLERGEPAGEREVLRRRELESRRDAPGPVERARQERLHAVRTRLMERLARRAEAPQPASFTLTTSQASSSTARRTSSAVATASSAAIGWTRARAPPRAPRGCGKAAR